jgi:hypothetical protein
MNRLGRWASKFLKQRNQQEEIDVCKVCLLTSYWNAQAAADPGWDGRAAYTEIVERVAKFSFEEQMVSAQGGVHEQVCI